MAPSWPSPLSKKAAVTADIIWRQKLTQRRHIVGRNKRQRIAPTQGHCAPNRRRAPVKRRNQEIAPYALRPSVELRESELQLVLPT